MAKLNRKSGSLKHGRPPLTNKSAPISLIPAATKQSSRATRTLIRAHHNLHKSRAKALAEGNLILVDDIDRQINQLGGLDAYQAASLAGQSKDRGGDSSVLLVKWLEAEQLLGNPVRDQRQKQLRVLEIGALSSQNAISAKIGKGIECVRRIDLKSQEPDSIEEIDFMDLPIPNTDNERFDVVSLSLVLNYVPDSSGRGEMLKKTRNFLRVSNGVNGTIPCLFFVVPLPCITNSRYITADRFRELMAVLGYQSLKVHQSAKLHYELFKLGSFSTQTKSFGKVEVNPGKGRNNFSVTLNHSRSG